MEHINIRNLHYDLFKQYKFVSISTKQSPKTKKRYNYYITKLGNIK